MFKAQTWALRQEWLRRDKSLLLPKENIIKMEIRGQKPWTAVSAFLGIIRMTQLADEVSCGFHMINIKVMENGRIAD